jgi:hypothetical protein
MSDIPFMSHPIETRERYDTHIVNMWAQKNPFINKPVETSPLPAYPLVRNILPDPIWSEHQRTIDCYWRAWELAFDNLKNPTSENGFGADYCDTAFNGNLFLWDSAFITCFGDYGRRAFDFQKTLDNFYCKQHPDGFICREIAETDGTDAFHRFDPSSTGPNVLAWAEWNHYLKTGDVERLRRVFAPLFGFHQWLRACRTWQDGSYWSTGWGCGMDNMPRLERESHPEWVHGHMTWVDATFQAILSAKMLLNIGTVIGEEEHLAELQTEIERLTIFANKSLWNEEIHFYCDRFRNGSLSSVKHIGAFWSLLAGCVPEELLPCFLAHLDNNAEFNRLHCIPSLSADDPNYNADGDYWCGGVWAPTNYMVLKGLSSVGRKDMAHRIGLNHNQNVVHVFEQDDTPWLGAEQFKQFFRLADIQVSDRHTLWENYAPDLAAPGGHSKPGYVGWTGIPPIAVLFEDIFGLTSNAPEHRLAWDIHLLEEHGVRRYPFGCTGQLDLLCRERKLPQVAPVLTISATVPVTLDISWGGGEETIAIDREDIPITLSLSQL